MEPLKPGDPETLGPSRLLARLGAGGMGRVYLARALGGSTVAVKVVRAEDVEASRRARLRFAARSPARKPRIFGVIYTGDQRADHYPSAV
jgi:hypothetical protein